MRYLHTPENKFLSAFAPLREQSGVQVRFLLGPAGSGKTFRCLEEIRRALRENPDGPPLVLLAPKQATFQLERQLLDSEWWSKTDDAGATLTRPPASAEGMADKSDTRSHRMGEGRGEDLYGYTRLQIFPFDRFARFALEEWSPAPRDWLDDEGRVMVLRALLAQKRKDLSIFHASARLPGFAARLSLLLRELQQNQISPEQLLVLAEKTTHPPQLRDKLHDFALLLRGYLDWLDAHQLQDANRLLDLAADRLRAMKGQLHLAGLWLDGFAEMTAQELDLLAAVVPLCDRATLAFCLDAEPQKEPSWLSPWSVIGQTFLRCRERLRAIPGVEIKTELIKRISTQGRFTQNRTLGHLEKHWTQPKAESGKRKAEIRLVRCANPEAEAVLAAREIRRFVRDGGRFRETAVLVRSLDGYADTLQRVFDRYEIPCFLDRRRPVAHHPLAELTRYALRTAAFGWRQTDWFGALKTGFAPVHDDEIDWLENVALEFGWEGNAWLQPFAVQAIDKSMLHMQHETGRAEQLRQKLVPPFAALARKADAPLTGIQLADTLRGLWKTLDVENTLGLWTSSAAKHSAFRISHSAIHTTVWEQMLVWLDNLELAFPAGALPLRDWLPVLEAGLATLSVGVIPPALDQVLVGAIDRSRNPELKLALVLGLNEGVFPAPPAEDPLLREVERDALAAQGAKLGAGARHRLGHEWFYGYIACTRASQRLVLTCADFDARGNKLNRSLFFDHLERLFPNLKLEPGQPPRGFGAVGHVSELIAPAVQLQTTMGQTIVSASSGDCQSPVAVHGTDRSMNWQAGQPALQLLSLPELAGVLAKARQTAGAMANQRLSPVVAEALHGRELVISVSGLEDFAACPFKFFASRGLRAEERKLFELDARERGSFQHELLSRFHNELAAAGRRWRDVSPGEARERIRRLGRELLPTYRHGLFAADAARRFAGELLVESLETLMAVLVGWARDYQFDPALVEVGFGLPDTPWPAWRVEVGGGRALSLRGRIDRVDVWRDAASGAALAVVMDYKSGSRKPDRLKLEHGLQLQLPTYLAALEQLPEVRESLRAGSLVPAGVFYVNLRGEFKSASSRGEALADPALALQQGFQHAGRYDERFLDRLDPTGSGRPFKSSKQSHDRMDPAAFRELLDRAVENLRRFGREIFAGKIAPDPFRKGGETACDYCDYASVCRFDPWTQPFRVLSEPAKVATTKKNKTK